MTDQSTAAETTTIDASNRPLAGLTKQYLDDLAELRRRTTSELMRGVTEGYLTADAARDLADRLGVERPRMRTRHYVYYEVTRPYRFEVQAYDDDDALQQAQEHIQRVIRDDSTDYTGGTRSRFQSAADGVNGRRLRVSELSASRPTLLDVLPTHPDVRAQGERVREARVREARVREARERETQEPAAS